MAAEVKSDWSTNSNEAFNISLVTPDSGATKTLTSFKPRFTYSLFDEESIFGYQGLKINLRYNACDMRPHVGLKWDKKFKAVNETEAQDLKPILRDFLPEIAFQSSADFEGIINSEELEYDKWTPPGTLQGAFDDGDSHYEVWRASLDHDQTITLLKRIQILVPLFIDGGTFIDLEHTARKRWSVFFLYEVKKDIAGAISPYVFMGYATVYRFYTIHNINKYWREEKKDGKKKRKLLEFKLPLPAPKGFSCRSRISQFVILPPFQNKGHGSRLYRAIFAHYLKTSNVVEITVEDPNEEFDNLRDVNDLVYLQTRDDFTKIAIDPAVKINKNDVFPLGKTVDLKYIEKIRCKVKIAPRQFARLVEMHLLSQIPPHIRQSRILIPEKPKDGKTLEEENEQKHVYHLWQLIVKTRLYRHNKDTLMQVDRAERADKLGATVASVEEGYAKLLAALEKKYPKSKEVPAEAEAATVVTTEEEVSEKVNGNDKRSADDADVTDEPTAKKVKLDPPTSTSKDGSVDEGGKAEEEKSKDVDMGEPEV